MAVSRTGLADEPAELPSELVGRVRLPRSADYETVRKPWDPRHHGCRPAAVVNCRISIEVAAVVRWAHRLGLRITPRSGGHCFAGRTSAGDVVVDVSEMNGLTVTDRHVEAEAGVRLGDLCRTLGMHRLTLPAGCGPSVGVAGLTLGGGLGLLGRRYGLTGLGWSADAAADLVQTWMEWAPAADDRLTAQLELSVPGDPDQPGTVSFLPMGGVYNRVPADATAFPHRHHRFLIEHLAGVRPTAAAGEQQAAVDWSAGSWRLVHPVAANAVYPNFPDADLDGWAQAYWGTNHARPRQIKRRYDPRQPVLGPTGSAR